MVPSLYCFALSFPITRCVRLLLMVNGRPLRRKFASKLKYCTIRTRYFAEFFGLEVFGILNTRGLQVACRRQDLGNRLSHIASSRTLDVPGSYECPKSKRVSPPI